MPPRSVALLLVAALAAGCAPRDRLRPAWPDAAVELRDDDDREQAIDRLWATAEPAARDRARRPIADAIARRLADAADAPEPQLAAVLFDQLTALWVEDPGSLARGLAHHAPLVRKLAAVFSRAGALAPSVQALVVLSELEPAARAEHLAALDEILAFADELAIAEHGPTAVRAQPIALLEPAALAVPLPWLVDRYVALQIERQRAVAHLVEQQGAGPRLLRAHHDFLATSHRIANALARAGRPAEVARQLARLSGVYGADRELAIRAEVVADQPTAEAYARLAGALADDDAAPDAGAALAVCRVGLARFPAAPALAIAAGSAARALGRVELAIAHYERALAAESEVDTAVALHLGRLYAEQIQRLATAGRPRAAVDAWRAASAFTDRQAAARPHTAWRQASALAESGLGRGLASQGMLDAAERALTASLDRAPSIDAYETLATIGLQTDRYGDAQRWLDQGIALAGDRTAGDRYRRAKLERLAGDGLRRAGHARPAAERYLGALRTWARLGDSKELPRSIAAERALDMARAMWWLGDAARAVELAMRALDTAPESDDIAAGAVSFLLQADRYRDALDAYHRGLREPAVSEFHKTYMSLWVLGEAGRRGEPRDRLAVDYLSARRGEAWHERLAQLAAGTRTLSELRPLATTGPRRAELAFYGVTLGVDPDASTPAGRRKRLEEVVAARLVLDAEYDLARAYLARP